MGRSSAGSLRRESGRRNRIAMSSNMFPRLSPHGRPRSRSRDGVELEEYSDDSMDVSHPEYPLGPFAADLSYIDSDGSVHDLPEDDAMVGFDDEDSDVHTDVGGASMETFSISNDDDYQELNDAFINDSLDQVSVILEDPDTDSVDSMQV